METTDRVSAMTPEELLRWDPDYTKLTPAEAEALAAAEKSGFVDSAELDWRKIGQ